MEPLRSLAVARHSVIDRTSGVGVRMRCCCPVCSHRRSIIGPGRKKSNENEEAGLCDELNIQHGRLQRSEDDGLPVWTLAASLPLCVVWRHPRFSQSTSDEAASVTSAPLTLLGAQAALRRALSLWLSGGFLFSLWKAGSDP